MPSSERKVVQQLVAHKREMAELVTSMHFERHPKLDEDYGEEGRTKCCEDTIAPMRRQNLQIMPLKSQIN